MTNRWLLPDHIADVLPTQARQIEETRRALLDAANRYGFELVMPPLVEHLDSLLIGAGAATGGVLDLQTFKLVDQHSGRSLGVRADTTPQVARIDAHLLNRECLTRLCYCGPVLHTRPAALHASREPLQFGAEIYGHKGLEADLEVIELALDSLAIGGVQDIVLDLSDVRLVKALLSAYPVNDSLQSSIYVLLSAKDAPTLTTLTALPPVLRKSLSFMLKLYGGIDVLAKAREQLPSLPAITAALDSLQWLAQRLMDRGLSADALRFDLADLGGYGYYTATRFSIYSASAKDALARGGRYDEVGAVFGRKRPAVGFSLDIKTLVESTSPHMSKTAIYAQWQDDVTLRLAVKELRNQGETVIYGLLGHDGETDEFVCDRELVLVAGQWLVKGK